MSDKLSFTAALVLAMTGDERKAADPVEQVKADRALVADEIEAVAGYRLLKEGLRAAQ